MDVTRESSPRMTEDQLQAHALELARSLGVLAYHTYDSRRSVPGFPDLVLLGARGVLWRELKSDKGRPSSDQLHWMEALELAGEDVAIWRPSDWPDRILREMTAIGRSRAQKPAPTQAQLRRSLQTRRGGGARNVPPVDIVPPRPR